MTFLPNECDPVADHVAELERRGLERATEQYTDAVAFIRARAGRNVLKQLLVDELYSIQTEEEEEARKGARDGGKRQGFEVIPGGRK